VRKSKTSLVVCSPLRGALGRIALFAFVYVTAKERDYEFQPTVKVMAAKHSFQIPDFIFVLFLNSRVGRPDVYHASRRRFEANPDRACSAFSLVYCANTRVLFS